MKKKLYCVIVTFQPMASDLLSSFPNDNREIIAFLKIMAKSYGYVDDDEREWDVFSFATEDECESFVGGLSVFYNEEYHNWRTFEWYDSSKTLIDIITKP